MRLIAARASCWAGPAPYGAGASSGWLIVRAPRVSSRLPDGVHVTRPRLVSPGLADPCGARHARPAVDGSRTTASSQAIEGPVLRRLADQLEQGCGRLVGAVGRVDGQVAVTVLEDLSLLG